MKRHKMKRSKEGQKGMKGNKGSAMVQSECNAMQWREWRGKGIGGAITKR